METNKNQIEFRVTMELEERWARNLGREELQEYLRIRLDRALGFRGRVKKIVALRVK